MFVLSRTGRMFALFVTLIIILSASVPSASAQESPKKMLDSIQAAFSKGESRTLMDYTSERMDMALFDKRALVSRGQAAYVMEEFFRAFPPLSCTFEEPTRTPNAWFVGGLYRHRVSADTFNVYVGLRRKGEAWELREIRINKP